MIHRTIQIYIGLALAAFLIYWLFTNPFQREPDQITIIQKDTPSPITINMPPGKAVVINQPIPADIDSFQIAQAYFAKVSYTDTIKNDSVDVMIAEVVSMNAIQSRTVGVRFKFPTVTEIHQESKRKLLIGGAVHGFDRVDVSLMGGYQDKKSRVWFGGYSTDRRFQVGVLVGFGR